VIEKVFSQKEFNFIIKNKLFHERITKKYFYKNIF